MNDLKNETQENYNEYEIDLKEYINILWDNKWFILGVCIIVILITGVYSQYIMEPQYQAKSTLLILPSKYKTSLEVATFPIETYKNLALTHSMKAEIIKDLSLKHDDGQPYSPSDLDDSMKIEVQAQSQSENNSLVVPLLVLKVIGSDPDLISNIANIWADIFMKTTKQIQKSEVREIVKVIQNQFDDTKQKLLNTKRELKDFNGQKRLGLVKDELSIKEKHLSNYKDRLISLKIQLGSEMAKYQQLQKDILESEKDGKWIGTLNIDLSSTDNLLLAKIKRNYLDSQNYLLEFKRDHNSALLKQKISLKTDEIDNYQKKIMSLESMLEDKSVEVQKISNLLKNEPDKWTLKKTVSEDVFWEKILTPKEIDILQNLHLNNEIINPIYQKLKTQLFDSKIIVDSIPEQIRYYQSSAINSESDLNQLNNKLNIWIQKLDRLKIDIKHYEALYEGQANIYQELKNKLVHNQLEIRSLESEVAFYEKKVNSLEQEVKNMQDFIWENEIIKQQLTQQVNDIQKTYNNLAEKVEEARITEAQKTSDVKFIARSVPPVKPFGPNKKLNIAIAGVLALMIGVFAVFVKELLKKE